ncbi:hypothetical protein ABZ801_33360 [Actinomadura sp. NPDC047616]|uniref:hypothetical protein n=1 Tax=Actinomadura sp. NPDC047616 TaxID=3155914 RepID=UPI0033F5DF1E
MVFEQIIAAHEAEQTLIAANQIADGITEDVTEDDDPEAAGRQGVCSALPPVPALGTAPATVATAAITVPTTVPAVSAPAPCSGEPPSIPAPRPSLPADQDALPADPGQVLLGPAGGNQDVGEDQDVGVDQDADDEPDETPVPPPVDAVVTTRHDATHEAAPARGAAHARALLVAARRRRSGA